MNTSFFGIERQGLAKVLLPALILCLSTLVVQAETGDVEVGCFYASSWTSTDYECGTKKHAKGSWDDVAIAWRDRMDLWNDASTCKTGLYESWFQDPSMDADGSDYNRIDRHDVAMLLTHGGVNNDWKYRAKMQNKTAENICSARQEHMLYGDRSNVRSLQNGDLEILILPGCNGLHYCTCWKWDFSHELHVINAFHGVATTGMEFVDRMKDYAFDGLFESASNAWFSNAYYKTPGMNRWQCPVVLAEADTAAHAQDLLTDERWWDVFDVDYTSASEGTRWFYTYCDPGPPGPEGGDTKGNTTCN